MKEPKSFKYPRLYWRPDVYSYYSPVSELVIIYPDGRQAERYQNTLSNSFWDS
jgi:hypothetical protein